MVWIGLGCTFIGIVVVCLFMMYREAMRDTLLEHTLSFVNFPMSFGKVQIFLFQMFIEEPSLVL